MVFSDNIDNTIAYHHDCLSLVERLRAVNGEEYPYANEVVRSLCHEAADRIAALEAQLAEARKALEQAEQQLDYGQVDAAHRIIIRAVRRVREGEMVG